MPNSSSLAVQDAPQLVFYSGVQNAPNDQWVPFEWVEPGLGTQVHGEITIVRQDGPCGAVTSGFWRTSASAPGATADGSHKKIVYSSPLGDETAMIIDGTAILTVPSTGEQFEIGAGSVVSSPKGLEVHWEVFGPSFKKYWCIWNGTDVNPNGPTNLQITHIGDNPSDWIEYAWEEPREGHQIAGQLFFIRAAGSTGTMMSGQWRGGPGVPGAEFVDEKGDMIVAYTAPLGDETVLVLEGEVEILETESGKKHYFRAGDAFGMPSGLHTIWHWKGPFYRKLWVITRDELPA